jgi:hypothetical protein
MSSNPYAAFKDSARPAEEAMTALRAMIDQAREKEAAIESLSAQLKLEQEALRDLTWTKIPTLMDEMGIEEIKTPDGIKVKVKEEIEAGISTERRSLAHKWLEENGHAGLIKREISVAFNRDQSEEAAKLVGELQGRFPGVSQDSKVHPATLKAWVREMLAKGNELPLDLFGVFRRRIAKMD